MNVFTGLSSSNALRINDDDVFEPITTLAFHSQIYLGRELEEEHFRRETFNISMDLNDIDEVIKSLKHIQSQMILLRDKTQTK